MEHHALDVAGVRKPLESALGGGQRALKVEAAVNLCGECVADLAEPNEDLEIEPVELQ